VRTLFTTEPSKLPINVSAVSDARFREAVEVGTVLFARSIRLKEDAGGCGRCGLWELNRFASVT
jgi:hypothetical protein